MKNNDKSENNKGMNQVAEKSYTPIDSVIMFFCTLILPTVFALPIYFFLNDEAKKVFMYIIPQVAILSGFLFLSFYRKVNIKKANQINFKLNIWIVLIVIAIGIVSIFGFSPLVNIFESLIESWGYKNDALSIEIPTIWSLIAKIIYIGLVPAICEELACRGVITNGLKKTGIVTTCVLSGVFFALMHQNLEQLVYQLFMGIVMAYIVLKTGSIVYTMILHFFNNAAILITTYVNQKNGVVEQPVDLSNAWNIILPIIIAIGVTGIVVSLLFLIKFIVMKKEEKQKKVENLQTENINNKQTINDNGLAKISDMEKIVTIVGIVAGTFIYILSIVAGFIAT